MFSIKKIDLNNPREESVEDSLNSWPVIYLLSNNKAIYVGETNDISNRLKQHSKDHRKKLLDTAHIVSSVFDNKSSIHNYEHRLIQCFSSDGSKMVLNKNSGFQNENYFDKAWYDSVFEELWEEVRKQGLAFKSINDIVNSDVFKFSPFKELTSEQVGILGIVKEKIISEFRSKKTGTIVLSGGPGTGKSIVLITLLKQLVDFEDREAGINGLNVAIVVSQSSLRHALKTMSRNIVGIRGRILGPSEMAKADKFDIILVDEAHRLRKRKNIANLGSHTAINKLLELDTQSTELDWVIKKSKINVLVFSDKQVVGPSGIESIDHIPNILGRFELKQQMRMYSSGEYLDFLNDVFITNDLKINYLIERYDFRVFNNFGEFCNTIHKIQIDTELTRIIAGFGFKWISKKDASNYDIEKEGTKLRWNSILEGWVSNESLKKEVGCIHTIQGFDLNYAGVILGPEIDYDFTTSKIIINEKFYHDINGKKTATTEELERYIQNIYYVLMSRGIRGTYVYAWNDNMKKYLESLSHKLTRLDPINISDVYPKMTQKPKKYVAENKDSRVDIYPA